MGPARFFSEGMEFERVAILGGGLLGGSLALRLEGVTEVRLWARRGETVAEAKAMGLSRATEDLRAALDGADLVILGVPVGAMPPLVEAALKAGLSPGALVTDVGSVKGMVHREVAPRLSRRGCRFIGSHPMAGGEQQGMKAAQRGLFENAMCLLTNDEGVDEGSCEAIEAFWRGIGCRTAWMDAMSHDALVARISHLPHVMAAAAARVALANPTDARFGGGGLRDTTRVAGGDPSMWTEILHENRDEVVKRVREARDFLGEMLASLEADDHETTRRWLLEASRLHELGKAARNHE
jgi:prephenate dehydrogenase